jgi:ribonucleoside-diphosphate reductase alpha chain
MRHRPIGIGVQGLANVFYEMGVSFDSDAAKEINKNIFETIYYGALESSMELSRRDGPYETFIGSPASKGLLQFDLWDTPKHNMKYDWDKLKMLIREYGLRNSLLLAPMPTASTSQILGNYECFEPVMSNIYSRRVLAGEYLVLNNYLVKELMNLDLWDNDMKDEIIRLDGSVQNVPNIPEYIKQRYKTAWEIKQKNIIDMSADRGKYICQSQSLNLFIESPSIKVLTSMHFYAWQKGLKTGIYYLRSRPSGKAIQFTLKPQENKQDEPCESCSG